MTARPSRPSRAGAGHAAQRGAGRWTTSLAGAFLLTLLTLTPAAAQLIPGGETDPRERHQRRMAEYRSAVLTQVEEQIRDWRADWRAGDVAAVAEHYTLNASLAVPGRDLVTGKDAVRRRLEDAVPRMGELLTGFNDFSVSASVAVHVGRYLYTDPDDPTGEEEGLVFTTFRKVDGEWRIRMQVFRPAA